MKSLEKPKGREKVDVRDLSREELIELKERYLDSHLLEVEDRSASYEEIASADEIVPDEMIFEAYECFNFVEEDFACNL